MKQTICLNGMLGKCPHCKFDVDELHHPNNLDCPRFKPLGFVLIDIPPAKEKDDSVQDVSGEA